MGLTTKKPTTLIAILLIFFLSACSSGTQSTSISVSGAFALYPLMVQWAEEYQSAHPDVRIDVSAGGAGKGMADVLTNAVDIGMVSRPVAQEEIDQGALVLPVARDAVFGTINAQNPYRDQIIQQGISAEMLQKIFMSGQTVTWGDALGKPEITDEIHVFTRSDSAGAAEMWAKYVGGKVQEDLQGIGVNGDPGILEAVIKDPLGMGFNNLGYAFDASTGEMVNGVVVLPLDSDLDGKISADEVITTKQQAMDAIAAEQYPSPPARNLFLVTKGKPTGAVNAFLNWILTEGQNDLIPSGYVQISAEDLSAAQDLLR